MKKLNPELQMVLTNDQLVEIKNELLKMEYSNVYKLEIEDFEDKADLDEDGKPKIKTRVEFYSVMVPHNRWSTTLKECSILVRDIKGGFFRRDNFIGDFVKVKVVSSSLKMIQNHGVWIFFKGNETTVYIKSLKGYMNLKTQEETEEIPSTCRHYEFLDASAANIRGNGATFSLTNGTNQDNRTNILDFVTNGAYSLFGKKAIKKGHFVKDEPALEIKSASKMINRFGQFDAGSKKLSKLKVVVVYQDTLKAWVPNENNELDENGNIIMLEKEITDGCCVGNENLDWIDLRNGQLKIAPSAVLGMQFQTRPGTHKNSVIFNSKLMYGLIRHCLEIDKSKVKICAPAEYFDDQGNYLYYDKNGVPERVDMFTDLNCYKLASEQECDLDLEVLSISKKSKAKTNKQFLEKMMYHDKDKCIEFMEEVFKKDLENRFKLFVQEVEPSIPSIKEIEQGYALGIIQKIAPSYIKKDKAFFMQSLRPAIEGCVGALSGMKWETEGYNCPLVPDFAAVLMGQPVLKNGQFFSSDSKMAKEAVVIKNPSMGVNEFLYLEKVDLDSIRKTINSIDIQDGWRKSAAYSLYVSISKESVILPGNHVIMFKCAGLDFDYDKAIFYTNKKVVEVFKKLVEEKKDTAIRIMQEENYSGKEMVPFNMKTLSHCWATAIDSPNEDVGTISNINSTIVQFLITVKYGSDERKENAIKMLQIALEDYTDWGIEGAKKYRPIKKVWSEHYNMFIIDVHAKEVESSFLSQILSLDWSDDESIINMLTDMNDLYRAYQELTIDAAKLAIIVNIIVRLKSTSCESLKEMKGNDDFKSFEINQYGEVPLFYIDRPSESSSALLYDYFAEFQDKKAKVIEKLINKNIKKAYELCSYSEEEKELFSGALLSYRQECEELMSILKRAYRTMSILEAEEKKSAGYNEDKIASVKAKYKEYKEILADNTRSALSKVSQEHKGIVLKAAACSQIGQNKKITIDYNDTNSYGYICEDLFLDMIVRNFAEETMCGYPIKNKEIELENGEEITFVNGIAKIEGTEEIISIPYIYTGTLKALNKNGKVYVVKNISDTIKFREANITKAIVGVRNTFDNKTFKDIKKIFSENNNEKVVSFNMAQRYGKGIIKNSVSLVAQLKSPTGEIVNGAETPIATYRTEKCLVSKLFMNKTGTIKDIQVHEDTSACFMIVSNLEEDLQRGRNASNLLRQNILDVTSTYTKVTNKKKEEVKINAEESDEI